MKPAPFDYAAPRVARRGAARCSARTSRPLAGGQSLVPLLNFRLARPARARRPRRDRRPRVHPTRRTATLRIGAMTRQATLERSPLVARRAGRCCAQAVRSSATPQIRTRGTVGGSVAHADPAAELPVAADRARRALPRALGARGAHASRPPSFFTGPLTTALEPDELLVEIEVPAAARRERAPRSSSTRARTATSRSPARPSCWRPATRRVALLGPGAVPTPRCAAAPRRGGARRDRATRRLPSRALPSRRCVKRGASRGMRLTRQRRRATRATPSRARCSPTSSATSCG